LTPATAACDRQTGHFEHGSLETDLLPDPLAFRIYLPPCYEQQPDHRYPTLYLLHGQGFTDDQWDRLGVDEIADALIASDQAAPLLIVMPRYHNWYGPAKNNFGQAVVDVLLPWIDNQYRTQPERSGRAIGGLSRGGAWALHLAFTRPDLFGSVGAHSGFIFHTDMPDASRWLDEIRPEQMPRIYLDVGHSDSQPIMQSMVWLEEQLTLRGIPHAWHLFRGEHVEAYWQAHVEQYLRWYAEGW
jgi:enterochelin esterase-like enzyme